MTSGGYKFIIVVATTLGGDLYVADKKTWKNLVNPKDITVRTRMDAETVKKLDKCCDVLETTRSDIMRKGIEKIYDDISEK